MDGILLKALKYNNRQDEIRLGVLEEGAQPTLGTVVVADNVDIDNNGKIKMRTGTSQVVSGATHSFYVHPEDPLTAYYMIGNDLYKLNADFSSTACKVFTYDHELWYDVCGTALVCTNGIEIGTLNGTSFTAFSQSTGQFEKLMPAGQFLVYDPFDKCLLVARGNIIYKSKPYNPEVYDERYGRFPVKGDISSIGVVEDGWYIGTIHGSGFAARNEEDGFVYREISGTPVIKQAFYNGYEDEDKGCRRFCAWASEDGLLIGYAGGEVKNLSYPSVALDGGETGRVIYREMNGTFQFIVVVNTVLDGFSVVQPTMTVNTVNV